MNIMIMSPGRRVEILEYFKKELENIGGKVYTVDMNSHAAAMFFSDHAYCVEKDFDNVSVYMENVLKLCEELKIDCVLSLIDPELPLLAEYKDRFEHIGVRVIVSEKALVNATYDKLSFFEYFKEKLPVLKTVGNRDELEIALGKGEISFPIIAKPRRGSGSVGIAIVENNMILTSLSSENEYVFQPYLNKVEYGVDMYFNIRTGKLEQYFIKEKLAMRSGETDKSVSVHNDAIREIVMRMENMGFIGAIDMDVFCDEDGKYYVNEINPRFGGGYPHAYYCGMNYVRNIVKDMLHENKLVSMDEYSDGIVMLKYNNYHFVNEAEVDKIVKHY